MKYTAAILGLALVLGCCLAAPLQGQPGNDDAAQRYAAAGQRALAEGHYDEAQSSFEALAKLDPGVAEVHATLAVIYFKLRKYEQAVEQIQTARRLKPSLPRLGSLLGLSLSELGRFTEALPLLEQGFKQTADPEIRRMCGLQLLRAYTGLSRDSDAVATSLALNRYYPNDPEVLYHTGRIYGNYAYLIMQRLHDKAPGSVWMLQAQGEVNESQKNYDAAIVAFNHVLLLDPKRPGIHYRLGRIYLERFRISQSAGDRESAMKEFTAELAIDPGNGNAGYELANIDAALGNLKEARQRYKDVLERYPDFVEALVGLGGVDLESKEPADAVTALRHATKLRPDDEVAWYRLSQAERAAGNKAGQQEALVQFRKLHSSTPVTLRKPSETDEVTPQQLGPDANP